MRYEAPRTLQAAIALLSGTTGQARVLAGGTDLLIQMRAERVEPELLVDIKGIPEMSAACRPIDDKRGTKEFRIKVAGVMVQRAAEIALERARRTN